MGDIKLLESVQRRAVNMVVGLQGLTYTETTDYRDQLILRDLCTLAEGRKKFDIVQVFKILRGIDNVDFSIWFTIIGKNVVRPFKKYGVRDEFNTFQEQHRNLQKFLKQPSSLYLPGILCPPN